MNFSNKNVYKLTIWYIENRTLEFCKQNENWAIYIKFYLLKISPTCELVFDLKVYNFF